MPAENAIGFIIEMDDQLSKPLGKIEKGYERAAAAVDKLNKSLQKRTNKTADALREMTEQLEALPDRLTKAAKNLKRTADKITTSGSKRGGGKSRGGSDDIVKSVQKAVEKALKQFSVTLKPTAPRVPSEMWSTRDYKKKWERMPPPPDYSGRFQKFQEGGEVQGPGGIDNVPALLTPGEVVLPVGVVNQLQDLLSITGQQPGMQGGGIVGTVSSAAAFGMGPAAAVREAAYIDERRGGFITRTFLEEFKEVGGKLGELTGTMHHLLRLEDSIYALKDTIMYLPNKITEGIAAVKDRLGMAQEDSLLPGLAKIGVLGATIAAISVEDRWVALRNQINLTGRAFREAQQIGYRAMVQFGSSADFMFGIMEKGMIQQKRSGEELRTYTNLVAQFALDNESLADSTGDLVFEMNRYGIATNRAENILSGMIHVNRETTLSLEQMTSGLSEVGGALRQLQREGRTSKEIEGTINSLNAAVGVMTDQWGDASTAYSVFNKVVSQRAEDLEQTAGLLAFVGEHTGMAAQEVRALAKADPAQFWVRFREALQTVDLSKAGEMQRVMAQIGEAGFDEKFIEDLRFASETDFTDRMMQLSEATRKAAEEGKLVQERYEQFANTISVLWNKVKNSFYAFFIQIGDVFLTVLKPFIWMFVKGLQMIAYALDALGKPGKIAIATVMALVAGFSSFLMLVRATFAIKLLIASIIGLHSAALPLVSTTWAWVAAKAALYKQMILQTAAGQKLASVLSFLGGKTRAAASTTYAYATRLPLVGDALSTVGAAAKSAAGWFKGLWVAEGATAKVNYVLATSIKAVAGATWGYIKSVVASLALSIRNAAVKAHLIVVNFLFTKGLISATTAQWAMNAAMYANPIGIVIAAIITLTAGMIALSTSTNKYVRLFVGMMSLLNPFYIMVMGIIDIFRTGGKWFSNFWWDIAEALRSIEAWLRGKGELGAFFADIVAGFKDVAYWISGLFANIWAQSDRFWNVVRPIWEAVVERLNEAFGMLRYAIADLLGMTSPLGDAAQSVGHDFSWVGDVLEYVGIVIAALIDVIGTLIVWTVKAAAAIIWTVSKVVDAVVWVVEAVMPYARMVYNLLTWPFQAAWEVIAGIWNGDSVWQIFKNVVKVLKNVFDSVVDAITRPFRAAFDFVHGIVQNMVQGVLKYLDQTLLMPLARILTDWGFSLATSRVKPLVALGAQLQTYGNQMAQLIPAFAEGGLVMAPTIGLIGEEQPEVVIPLDRFPEMVREDIEVSTPEMREMVSVLKEIKGLLARGQRRGSNIDPLATALVNEFKVF